MRVAATIQLGVAIGFVVLALALRGPIEDGLLDGNETLYWIGVGAVAAYGASYFARGFLAGSHRLTLYAAADHLASRSRAPPSRWRSPSGSPAARTPSRSGSSPPRPCR